MDTYQRIYGIVSRIPAGKVASYGHVAVLAGLPGQARLVGNALYALCGGDPPTDVPWWRVVNRNGHISNPYHPAEQRRLLEGEGVCFDEHERVDLARCMWDGEQGGLAATR